MNFVSLLIFQVGALPLGGRVEIEAVALVGATTVGGILQCQ